MRQIAFVLLLAAGCAAPDGRPAAGLRVGTAEVDITPPQGYRMSGYFYERLNTGTIDPLKAKAIVFDQDGVRAALVFCDLSGVPGTLTSKARAEAERATGIPAARIAIAATHTHTGPLFHGALAQVLHERAVAAHGKDPQDFDYPAFLGGKLVDVIGKAAGSLKRADLAAGRTDETTLSFNRRFHMKDGTVRTNPGSLNPEIVKAAGPIDPEVAILSARDGDRILAALTVFALHCDTTGGTDYSPDYPGFLEKTLRAQLSPDLVSLFGAGTCGNINHLDVTRKERRFSPEIGSILGRDVLAALPRLETLRPSLAMRSRRVDVPRQTRTAEQVAAAKADVARIGRKDVPFLDQVRIATTLSLDSMPPALPLEVQVLRLSRDAAIVLLPGEIFVEHGLAIKRRSPFRTTFVIELANENCAYVPNRDAYAQGGYEVENSRVAPGGGEKLVEAAVESLLELADAKS